jgi:Tol biopolymer transport system component/tRNA A-37 threonylcarbamoyl transferase component Bud32
LIGQTLSHFNITAKLGEGGMGEVYLGEDTKLGRQVAIKVLPDAFTEDPERLARFEREAKVLASLTHSNIAGIHQVEQVEGKHFLVMELAEGETLAERIARGPIPVDEAVGLALQITEGLEAAHLRGIVHRDLKPANIKVTPDRQIKILDFGLARAMTSDPGASGPSSVLSQSPTLAAHMTGAGMIMGTAAYMAPEQARGETVDARADVWAFGVVLMEMLTGKSVWAASTVSDTLAAVLAREPNWDDLDAATPRAIRSLLERCLQKEARGRLQAIGEARLALDAYVADPEGEAAVGTTVSTPVAPTWKRVLPWVVAGGALIAAISAFMRPAPTEQQLPVRRFVAAQTDSDFSSSPDGGRIMYTVGDQMMIRELDQLAPRTGPDLEGASMGFWSPDGSAFAFTKEGKLWRADSQTLGATVIAEFDEDFRYLAGAWSPSGTIYLAKWRGGLFSLPASGGTLKEFLPADETLVDFHDLEVLPDGESILANPHLTSDFRGVEIIRDGERTRVHEFEEGTSIGSISYSPTGHLLYTGFDRNIGIWAVPFSLEQQEATGEPALLIRDGMFPKLGADGSMSYLAGSAPRQSQLIWVDRQGRLGEPVGEQVEGIFGPQFSPDTTRVAYSRSEQRGGQDDIYIFDFERSIEERLTSSPYNDSRPTWTPDGKRIAFHRDEGPWEADSNRIWLINADGTGEPEPLVSSMGSCTFTPDSKTLIFTNWDVRLEEDILQITLDREAQNPTPVITGKAQMTSPRLSPDGKLLAYSSDETGEDQIYLTRYPGTEQKWQVSRHGGRFPQWSSDGTHLFFHQRPPEGSGWRLMGASIASGADPSPGRPELLFAPQGDEFTLSRGYAAAPDSQRFLVVREFGAEATDIVTLQNWRAAFSELTQSE